MSEIVFHRPDPMEEIDQLRAELDVAMIECQRLQDFTRALNIKAALEQKISNLNNLIDPWQYKIRQDFAKEYGYSFVSRFFENGQAYVHKNGSSWLVTKENGIQNLGVGAEVLSYSEDVFFIKNENVNRYEYINTDGKVFFNVHATEAHNFSNGLAYINPAPVGNPFFINKYGRVQLFLANNYNKLYSESFSDGMTRIFDPVKSQTYFMDTKLHMKRKLGKYSTRPTKFVDGICGVTVDANPNKRIWKLMNKKAEIISDYYSVNTPPIIGQGLVLMASKECYEIFDQKTMTKSAEINLKPERIVYSTVLPHRIILASADITLFFDFQGKRINHILGSYRYRGEGVFGRYDADYLDINGEAIFI